MGKIKTKTIKKAAQALIEKDIEFSESFEKNKKILKNISPSKKVRNQIAGYIARLKKRERKEKIS